MKRRECITSLVVLGCIALIPLPKAPTARVYQPLMNNDSHDLTPEMMDRVFEYFQKEVVLHVRFCYKRDKIIMDLLER